jgi:recombination protein RecT
MTGQQVTRPFVQPAGGQQLAERESQESIKSFFTKKETMQLIGSVLPKTMTPERMLRLALFAINKTKNLEKVPMVDLLGAVLVFASLGIEPNTPMGQGWLIPFKRKKRVGNNYEEVFEVQTIVGYKGWVSLARRSGEILGIHADVVYDGDQFSFEYGTNEHLRHIPMGDAEGREATHAYAYAKLKGEGSVFEAMPIARVLRIRNGSQGYQQAMRDKATNEKDPSDWRSKNWADAPWVKHFYPMARKTAFLQLKPWLPMSVEVHNALQIEEAIDRGAKMNFEGLIGTNVREEYIDPDKLIEQTAGTGDDDGQGQQAIENKTGHGVVGNVVTDPKAGQAQPARTEPKKTEPKKAAAKPEAKPAEDKKDVQQQDGDQRPEPPGLDGLSYS